MVEAGKLVVYRWFGCPGRAIPDFDFRSLMISVMGYLLELDAIIVLSVASSSS